MTLFHPDQPHKSPEHARVYAAFEIAYTAADFAAAALFIAGSIFFFYDSLTYAGTWMFLVGSVLFAAKPSLRLAREIKLARMGDVKDLSDRLKG